MRRSAKATGSTKQWHTEREQGHVGKGLYWDQGGEHKQRLEKNLPDI